MEKGENKNSYYSRVLNKFLHEETFDLTNQMRDIILNNLNDFLNGYKNISKEDLEIIKNIIAHIKKQCTIDDYNIDKSEYVLSKRDLHSLEKFNKMIDIAEQLASDFQFVRVDLYNVNGKIYFGEITFFPFSGFGEFRPKDWNRKLGDMIKLPIDV